MDGRIIRAGLAVGVAVVTALTLSACGSSGGDKPAGSASVVPVRLSADRTGLVVGNGPVKVEFYSDFLCPFCRAVEVDTRDEIAQLVTQRRITLVYRPVAILDRASTTDYSTRAANGAACAADQGKLLDYVKVLYDNQPPEGGPGLADAEIVALAAGAGLTGTDFTRCVTDGRYVDWVQDVTVAMERKGIRATPTVIVAGTQLTHPTGQRLLAAVAAAT